MYATPTILDQEIISGCSLAVFALYRQLDLWTQKSTLSALPFFSAEKNQEIIFVAERIYRHAYYNFYGRPIPEVTIFCSYDFYLLLSHAYSQRLLKQQQQQAPSK